MYTLAASRINSLCFQSFPSYNTTIWGLGETDCLLNRSQLLCPEYLYQKVCPLAKYIYMELSIDCLDWNGCTGVFKLLFKEWFYC